MSSNPLSIQIDDYEFTLLNKKILRDPETGIVERIFIDFISKNNITNTEINLTAYTSISELGCLRVCFVEAKQYISKFDNYVQSTIMDFRLQKFIMSNINTLQEIDFSEQIPCPQKNSISIDLINNRGINLNSLTTNRNKSTTQNTPLKSNEISNINISEPPSLSLFNPDLISDILWNEDNFDIIDSNNLPINPTTRLSDLKNDFMTYDIELSNIQINNNIFGIRIKNKFDNNIVIVVIGHCKLTINNNDVESIHREGYYILNLLPEDYKIISYGIYDKYYDSSAYGDGRYNPVDYYVTKPLEYRKQLNLRSIKNFDDIDFDNLDINNGIYHFIAQFNKNKFIIKQLLHEDFMRMREKDTYKQKYLKYKNKYLLLKKQQII